MVGEETKDNGEPFVAIEEEDDAFSDFGSRFSVMEWNSLARYPLASSLILDASARLVAMFKFGDTALS